MQMALFGTMLQEKCATLWGQGGEQSQGCATMTRSHHALWCAAI